MSQLASPPPSKLEDPASREFDAQEPASNETNQPVLLALFALLLGHTVVDALAALVPSTLGLLEVRIGMSPEQSAWLLGLGPLFSGLSQPACAMLSDWYHTRRWGVVGLAMAGIGICSLGFASEMAALVVIYIVGMVGVGMFHPVAATTIGALKQHDRNNAMSLFFVSGMVGGVLGSFCWPRFLTTATGFNYLPIFMVPVALILVVTQKSFRKLPPPKFAHDSATAEPVSRANWQMVGFLYLAACARFCVNLSLFYLYVRWIQGSIATQNITFTDNQIASAAAPVVGNLNAATLLGMAIGGLVAGKLVRVGQEKLPMILVPILFSPIIALFPYMPLYMGYVLAVLAGIGFASMIPINIALAQKLLPHRANLASSLMMGGAWTVAMLGPPLAEYSVGRWGLNTSFLLTAAGLVASGLICIPLQATD